MKFIEISAHIALGSSFVPATIGIFYIRKQQKALKILSAFAVFCVVTELVNLVIVMKYKINVFPLHHTYTVIEFSCALIISSIILYPAKNDRIRYFFIFVLVLSFTLIDLTFFESLDLLNSIPRVIEGLTMIAVSILFFYKIFVTPEVVDILKYPYFWLFTGWLIYFSGTFFLFVYSYKLV
ncbi:MAG: hypothetical protein IPO32_06870 [Crocinitomicaceae bacterium]|nr:hypothetical protein [Crocinitomicaceae bacterium]